MRVFEKFILCGCENYVYLLLLVDLCEQSCRY